MDTTVKKSSVNKIPFLERPIVRTILPIAGFADYLYFVCISDRWKTVSAKEPFSAAQPVLYASDLFYRCIYGHDHGRT